MSYIDHDQDGSPRKVRKTVAQKLHLVPPEPVKHERTQEFTASVTDSLVREVFDALRGDDALHITQNLVRGQVQVVSGEARTEKGRETTRIAAIEATIGSYDAMEGKFLKMLHEQPQWVGWCYAFWGAYSVIMGLGFLLLLWRMVIFGFGPIYGP